MEKFVVSARKYRPQNFASVVGQDHITTTLKNAIMHNQLAHAFLFCGPRGVGKTTCARILAKTINCENRTLEGEACNQCPSCISFNNGTSLNIHELDAASNNSVDDIRALVDQVRFAPQAGKYKVYIVDEVHMLSTSAFNAFLKTLEEPPPYAIFILATTEKQKILPTILSRCQIFDFRRMTNAATVDFLKEISKKEDISADEKALHLIARKGEGCMRDSLSLYDKIVSFSNGKVTYENALTHLNILDEDYYFKMLELMQQQKLSEVLLVYDEINRKGFEGDAFLNGFAEFLRNLLVSKDPRAAALLEVAEDFKLKYKKVAEKISPSWLISSINIVADSEVNLRLARNKRLHTELTLIKLCYLEQAVGVTSKGGIRKEQEDASKSLSFKALVPIRLPERKKTAPKKVAKNEDASSGATAKLLIEKRKSVATPRPAPATSRRGRIKSLEEIKQEIIEKQNRDAAINLDKDELLRSWQKYIEYLQKEGHQSAVQTFQDVRTTILNQDHLEVIVTNDYQRHFIESEHNSLIDHLQRWFHNPKLTYTIRVESAEEEEQKEEFLSSREKYLKIIEQYPEVQKLKERLKLKLDI